ncbi:MAG TPA: MarR family transcriptional regulator [Acidimicrobiales bacterium]|nr:MarR family transcriptional regulator [Acidimicrobiales bacterium]HKH25413.1 MarR family transcriptional regulator [Acidimicrobiales bacterium]
MKQSHRGEADGGGRTPVAELYDSTFRLVSSWTTRTVTQLLYARAGIGIGPIQHVVLRQAQAAGPLKLGRLAALTGMTASNASKVVTDLVDAGMLRREVPDDDRRVTLLQVTAKGRGALVALERVGGEMLGERLASFTPVEVDDLRRLLSRLADEVESWGAQLVEGGDGGIVDDPGDEQGDRRRSRTRGGTAALTVEES